MIQEKLKENIEYYYKEAKEIGDYLRDHPEISGEEENSCRFLVGFLEKAGYQVETPYGGMPHSFRAIKREKTAYTGKKAAILCEYDALPKVGHACGHAFSCAISMLSALAMERAFPDFPMRIDLIGTPGEEFMGGKCLMTDNGAFDEYEYAVMVHLNNRDVTYFEILASNDRYFTFHGKTAHASSNPEKGLNALNAARLFMDAMDMWRQHITKDCQFHGIVAYGGDLPNIVPDKICLDYYYRAATMGGLHELNKISENCARGAALATGTTVTWEQRYSDYCELYWNDYMDEFVGEIFREAGREPKPSPGAAGSSDIGNVNQKIPVFHPMLDVAEGRCDCVLHDQAFEKILHTDAMNQALHDGAYIICRLAYNLAFEPDVLERIQADHKKYRKIRS